MWRLPRQAQPRQRKKLTFPPMFIVTAAKAKVTAIPVKDERSGLRALQGQRTWWKRDDDKVVICGNGFAPQDIKMVLLSNVIITSTTEMRALVQTGAGDRSSRNLITINPPMREISLSGAGHQQPQLLRGGFNRRDDTPDTAFIDHCDAVRQRQYFVQVF